MAEQLKMSKPDESHGEWRFCFSSPKPGEFLLIIWVGLESDPMSYLLCMHWLQFSQDGDSPFDQKKKQLQNRTRWRHVFNSYIYTH